MDYFKHRWWGAAMLAFIMVCSASAQPWLSIYSATGTITRSDVYDPDTASWSRTSSVDSHVFTVGSGYFRISLTGAYGISAQMSGPGISSVTYNGDSCYIRTAAGSTTAEVNVRADADWNEGAYSLVVECLPFNQPPIASFTATPLTGRAPLLVNFTGTASSDPDGAIASYAWDFDNNGTTDATGPTASYTYSNLNAIGNITYTARLTVVDSAGVAASATRTIEVAPQNLTPTANFTAAPSVGRAPLVVTFNGTASSDPDGAIASYAWDFDNNGTTDATSATTSFSYGNTGTTVRNIVAKLTVTDGVGESASITRSIAVYPASNWAISVSGGATDAAPYVAAGSAVRLFANAPAVGQQFDRWSIISGSGSFSSVTAANATFTIGASDTVIGASYVPDITAPQSPLGLNISGVTSASFWLSWTAATDNVAVTGYEIYCNGVSIGTTSGSVGLGISGLSQDSLYQVKVRARDAAGNWSAFSAPANVKTWHRHYTGSGNISSWENFDEYGNSIGWEGTRDHHSFTLSAAAQVQIYTTQTSISTNRSITGWGNSGGVPALILSLPAGTYVVEVKGVPDSVAGAYQLNIDVPPLPETPIANFVVNPDVGRAPLVVNVDGSTSMDPDGAIAGYAWDFDNNGTTDATGVTAATTLQNLGSLAVIKTIKLSASDSGGRTGATTRTVLVYPESSRQINVNGGMSDLPYVMTNGETTIAASSPPTGKVFTSWTVVGSGTVVDPTAQITRFIAGSSDATIMANYVSDVLPPSVPGSLSVGNVSATSASLAWHASSDNVAVTGYEILDGANTVIATTSSTSIMLSDLAQDRLYQFRVRAFDAAGLRSEPTAAFVVRTWQRRASGSGWFGNYYENDAEGNLVEYTASSKTFVFTVPQSGSIRIFTTGSTRVWGLLNGPVTQSVQPGADGNFDLIQQVGSGTYSITVHRSDGNATGSFQVYIDYGMALQPDFSATPTSGTSPLLVTFDASKSYDPASNSIVSYAWDFDNDGATDATGPSASHIFGSGFFTTKLTITNSAGMATSMTRKISTANQTLYPIVPGSANPTTARIGETVILTAPATWNGSSFVAWMGPNIGTAIEDVHSTTALFTILPYTNNVWPNYYPSGALQSPTTTLTTSAVTAQINQSLTVTASSFDPANNLIWDRIDYSTDYGTTWIEGTLIAGTRWEGSGSGSHDLSSTFSFANPGLVIFRATATRSPSEASSFPAYRKVFITTPAESDSIIVINGTADRQSGPDGTVVSLAPMTSMGAACWWELVAGSGTFDHPYWPWARFTKGQGTVVIRANYGSAQFLTLAHATSNKMAGAPGSEFQVTADASQAGQIFDHWQLTGQGLVVNPSAASTTFVMGAGNAALEAVYRAIGAPSVTIATTHYAIVTGNTFTISASATDPDRDLTSLVIDYSPDDGRTWIPGTTLAQEPALDPTRWDGTAEQKSISTRFRFSPYRGMRCRFRARAMDAANNFSNYAFVDVGIVYDRPMTTVAAKSGMDETIGTADSSAIPILSVVYGQPFTIAVRSMHGGSGLMRQRLDLSRNGGVWGEGSTDNQRLWERRSGIDVMENSKTFDSAELGIGTYKFKARGWASSTSSDYEYVTVVITNPTAPTILAHPASQSVIEDERVQFSLSASGTNIRYRWRKNGVIIAGATIASFTLASAQAADSGTYSVDVWNDQGSVTSLPATLTVNRRPVAAFTATPGNGQAPLSVTFNASSSSDADGTIGSYVWDFGDGRTGSGLTATHIYQAIGNTSNYTAKLLVTDDGGATAAAAQVITVTPAPGGGADSDNDGIPDAWEDVHGLNKLDPADSLLDPDQDGWTSAAEYNRNTDPHSNLTPGASMLGDGALDSAWPAASTPGDYVGTTLGVGAVNLSGAATYSIPVKVTPGSVGIQPKLSLEYSSQGGDSYLGIGWQLRGLPAITRGPATIATDGIARGMNFTSQDKFYLDGARLVAINGGVYGADLTEYRTEIDSFSRIVSYSDGSAGSGPSSFRVWTKSGQVLEFGAQRNARLAPAGRTEVLVWAVSNISDLSGNSMAVGYTPTSPTDEILPDQISYTCNSAAPSGFASVKFDYKTRSDPQSGFAFDARTKSTKLLEKITIKSGTSVFRQYRLVYDDGTGTQPSRLRSVQEAADDLTQNSKVYPATTFDYYAPPAAGLNTSNSQVIDGAAVKSFAVDMNGDGLTDLVRIDNRNAAWLQLYQNDGTTFAYKSEALALSGADFQSGVFLTTDMDGDGRSEIIIDPMSATLPLGILRQIKLNSSNSDLVSTDISISGIHQMSLPLPCMSADFTGDGRDDLILVQPGLPGRVQLLVSTGTNYTPYDFDVPDLKNGLIEIGDFTGDGIADILNVVDEANDRRVRVFSVSTSGVMLVDETILGPKRTDWRTMIADVNGDGQLDLLYSYKDTNGSDTSSNRVQIWTRTGHGAGGARFVNTATQWMGGWNDAGVFRYVPFDYDGDRKTDIAILYKPAADETRLAIWQAAGPESAPFTANELGAFQPGWMPNYVLSPAQLNRDGLGDLLYVGFRPGATTSTPVTNNTNIRRLLSKLSASGQAGAFPNLLSAVTNGLGAKTKFSYLSLLADDIYTLGSGSIWPNADVRPPFRVVSIMESDRSGGQSATVQYAYGGLRINAQRGFRGFEWIKSYDSTTRLETKDGYFQAFPLTNLPSYTEVRSGTEEGGGTLVGRTEFTATTSASGGVHRPYTDTSYAKEYDLTGNAARTRYRKVMQDTYGNITSTYERVAAGIVAKDSMVDGENLPAGQFERKVDIPTFSHDVSGTNWLISRPTRSETYARSGDYPNEAVTRVTAMEYVTGTNRVGYITQEPDSGQESYRLRTDFGYDPYGNVNSVTLSSPGAGVATIETRTTSTDYSASADNPVAGRFPQQVMDGLGQKMTLVYDAVTGQLRKSKDEATGLETTWDYDAFGVQTLETRPDTTTTTTTYRWDSTSVAMENGSSVTAKYHVDVRNSGAPPALRRYDALGLPIQRITIAGDGASRFSETRYDDRNNVVAASRPHTATGSFYWTTTDYDAFNRPITRHVPAPPPPGSAAGASSTRDTFSWSYLGLAVTESDARALGTTRTANALGFAASMENNPTFAAGAADRSKLTYKYDGFGNLREAIDAANNTVNTTYDRLGRKTQVVDPNMGTWNYAYYANGLLRTQTDAKTSTATFTYDKLDRPKDKTIGNRVTSWTYKINASTTPLNGARQLEQATATEGGNQIFQQTWTYDGQSRVSGTTRSFGGKSYAFGQTYDSAGRPWVNTYPSSDGASFATIQNYSALGFLKEVRRYDPSYTGNLGQIYWQAADYEEDGQLRMAYIGNGAAVDRMHYAENGRPAGDGISVNPPHGSEELPPLLLQSYGFDGVGNLTSRGVEFTKADGNPASYTETFTYDGMNRVQYVDHSTAGRTNTYLYNSIGNLTSKDGHAFDYTRTVNTEPLAPHAVRSALGATYTYDASGNLTGNSAGTTVTWRTFNQPDRITRGTEWSEFTYGADDERIIQTTQNGTQTRYVGSLYEVTVPQGNASLTEVRAYVMTPLGRTAVVQFNGGASAPTSTRYLTQDQITSTSLVTDEAGRARERFSYDPWGAPRHAETLATSNAWPDRQATTRGFTDHEMLSRLQLVHMNGRIYNPTLGRFMSPDPFVNDADGTQMLNRYAYVRNNPLSLTDPSGYQVASTSSAGSEIVRGDTVVVRGDRVPTTTWKPFNPSVGVTTGVGANTTSGATLNHSAPNSEGSYFDDEAYAIYRGDIIAGRRPLTDEDIWFDPTLLSDVAYRRAAVVMKQSAETAVDWSHVGPFYDGVQAVTGHDLEGERVSRAEKGIKVAINIGVGKVVAIVGTAVGVVVKYAIRFHHPWPMYLRGKIQQILEPLPKDVHDAYHNGLDKFLPRQASDGVNRGKAVYDNMSDADIREVFRKLEAYTKDFDVKNNTHLWDAMRREGFPGNP